MPCASMRQVESTTPPNRVSPDLPAKLVFTDTEIKLLEHLIPMNDRSRRKTIGRFLTRLAKLGGSLGRTRDAPPGNMVHWRGMTRLTDIHLGFSLPEMWVIERMAERLRYMSFTASSATSACSVSCWRICVRRSRYLAGR